MTLPLLNRKLVLEHAVRSPDRAGGYATRWEALGTLWGEITPGAGGERAANALALSRVPLRIVVRAAPAGSEARPTAGQRFREGPRTYTILAVSDGDTRGRYLTCRAQEEVVR